MSTTGGDITMGDSIVVEKSASDERLYRYLVLPNELRVLLVSDPSSEKASAAIDVNVGSYSDIQGGEAHFLEHLLFMGTKKYPNENDYSQYLSKHGGSSNAYTDLEHTNYYLDVSSEHLEGALDRFSQFFIAPLLNEDSLDKERQAVDSEHAKNLQSDMWRKYQLCKSLSRKDHPYSKFGTGNQESLSAITHESLLEFYENNYSSNRMSLAVLGTETLDELEKLVAYFFTDIPNRSLQPNKFPGQPFQGILPLILQVIPVKQAITLEMQFPMRETDSLYLSKPTRYLAHLIGHESKGSLFALLKNNQWAHDLSAGTSRNCSDWSSFAISITLTDQGFEHYEEIVGLVFEYVEMLKKQGPQEWIFEETKTVADCSFRFLNKREPMDYTSSIATNVHMYDPEHILSGDYVFRTFEPTILTEIMSSVSPENMLLLLAHPKAYEGKTTETETWYGVQYNANPIPEELLTKWSAFASPVELHLPERNNMIATDFVLKNQEEESKEPSLLLDSPVCRLWYKPDTEFRMPTVNLLVNLLNPVAYASPIEQVKAQLWQMALEDSCNDFSYLASMAGLHCQVSTTRSGLEIHISGYNHKISKLAERIVQVMKSLDISDEVFERLQAKLGQDLENFSYSQAYQHAMFGADMVLLEHKWTPSEKMDILPSVTGDSVLEFGRNTLIKICKLEMLIHGNMYAEEAENLAMLWVDGLEPQPPTSLPEDRVVQLVDSQIMRFPGMNPDNSNSVVEVIYQMGDLSLQERAHLAFLQHVIKEPAFHQLRTEEQLGYIVHTAPHTSGASIKGLMILIQSDAYDPVHLESRVDVFIEGFRTKLVEAADFENNVQAVVKALRDKPKNLMQESTIFWDAVCKRNYCFHARHKIADFVEALTPSSVLEFFDKNVAGARKLSVQVFGSNHLEALKEEDNVLTLESVLTSKRSMPLFPSVPDVDVTDRLAHQ
jgi:insulysin